jgi:phosphoenolpyruvate-protein kinase (PTS system EI component)
MNPAQIPAVKAALRGADPVRLHDLTEQALSQTSAHAVRQLAQKFSKIEKGV